MSKATILPDTAIAEIKAFRDQKQSLLQIAEHYKVSRGTIRRFMETHHIQYTHLSFKSQGFDLEYIKAAYARGVTLTALCTEYDCDYATLRSFLKANGVERRATWSRNTTSTVAVVHLPTTIKTKCVELYAASASIASIAREVKLTPASVYKILRTEGVTFRKPGPIADPAASKEKARSRVYGVPVGWYVEQLARQNGCCAICGVTPEDQRNRKATLLSIDHRHSPHQVRGLLCHTCNLGIGHFGDSAARVIRAAEYLKAYDAALVTTCAPAV